MAETITEEWNEEEFIALDDLIPHPDNPRTISPDALDRLKEKVEGFLKMLEKRPICYDEDKWIWGGNKRWEALKALGYEKIPKKWTSEMIGYTEQEKKDFMFYDNVSDGQWNREMLQSDIWKDYDYGSLGDDILKYIKEETDFDYSKFFEEGDGDKKDKGITKIVLEYPDEQAKTILERLKEHGKTPEKAILSLLEL